ncbi:Flp family type IVb pilin [Propylenella binzhouense]|uniref:Flp family type IVb pilin n=1 Tax=Propylenella binzhouense TaxID=2555902 RepID=UPI0031B614CF
MRIGSIKRCLRDESGATAVEYGVMASMLALIVITLFGPGGTFDWFYGAFDSLAKALMPDGL